MIADSGAALLVVWIPLLAVWILVVIDLIRQTSLSPAARWGWGIACTLLWPAMIAYLLMRPTSGRLATTEERTDPRARLVDAILDREAGRIGADEMAAEIRALRQHP